MILVKNLCRYWLPNWKIIVVLIHQIVDARKIVKPSLNLASILHCNFLFPFLLPIVGIERELQCWWWSSHKKTLLFLNRKKAILYFQMIWINWLREVTLSTVTKGNDVTIGEKEWFSSTIGNERLALVWNNSLDNAFSEILTKRRIN